MLKTIVLRQKKEKETFLKGKYVKRNKEEFARKWIDSDLIKVVLGPRRAGKSVFCFMLLKDRPFMYFNFDDEAFFKGKIEIDDIIKELHTAYGDVKTIFFDEIQNLPHFELILNRLKRQGYNLIVTGSDAKLLSGELATSLTGRFIPIEIFPFDFNEFLEAKQVSTNKEYLSLPEKRGILLNLLNEYLLKGGFPETATSNIDQDYYLKVLFDSLLLKDVVKRYNVKLSNKIIALSSYLVDNFTSPYSLRNLEKVLNFKSITTIENYISYLEEAFLLFSLEMYSFKAKQRITSPKKIYIVDNGFIRAKRVGHSQDIGKLMENLVFIELVKKGLKPNRDFFYFKTKQEREIDFVIKKGAKVKELIQVCYNLSDEETKQREIKALKEAQKELKAKTCKCITWDTKGEIGGIKFIPLLSILLS